MRYIEESIQMACVEWFGYQFPEIRRLLCHIPNGGKRNAREAARFKKAGVISGAPDLVLFVSKGSHHTLCIEMKAPGKGKQTDLQKSWQELAEKHGNKYIVCTSFDEFRQEIRSYLLTT